MLAPTTRTRPAGSSAARGGRDHARRCVPRVRVIPMMNAERSPTFYRFDSMEQFQVWKEMDERDEEPIVIYHSHTATEAYPSRTPVACASEPAAHYVLVSPGEPDTTAFRSYRIVDEVITEE